MQVVGLLSNRPPTTKQFAANMVAMFAERSRRILKLHQEFKNLTDFEQVCIFKSFLSKY